MGSAGGIEWPDRHDIAVTDDGPVSLFRADPGVDLLINRAVAIV